MAYIGGQGNLICINTDNFGHGGGQEAIIYADIEANTKNNKLNREWSMVNFYMWYLLSVT